jgi:hypothetical protein
VRTTKTELAEMLRLLNKPPLLMWVIYLIAQPFYLFKTGLPQPGDMLILLLMPVVLIGWNGKLTRTGKRSYKPLLWFTLWVCIVDYGWALILGKWGVYGVQNFLLFPTYYIYNAIIFLIALILHQRYGDAFLRLTLWVVFAIIIMLVMVSFVYPQVKSRGSLFFANPNQLGYHALLSACIIALLTRKLDFGAVKSGIAMSACAYLSLISASRSALFGIAVLVALLVFSNLKIVLLSILAALALYSAGGPIARAIDTNSERAFRHRNPTQTFWQQRGYDRISAHKEYLVLGAGEGGTDRFKETTKLGTAEIHSTAGTILFSYGIVGSLLFLWFVWRLVEGAAFRASMLLVPPLLYTFAHQGLRFTLLWVLIPIFVVIKDSQVVQKRFAKPVPNPIPRAA